MNNNQNEEAFFALLRAGLWEREARLARYKDINYAAIMKMAEEQSVVGLITAGLEQVKDVKIPQEWILQFIGSTLQIEQRNKAMNEYLAKLIENLRENGIYTLLVKGQGIAQCYERPHWRACGDVDLLLSSDNYEKAKKVLLPLARKVEEEHQEYKHLGMTTQEGFMVELHGTLHGLWSKRVDRTIDEIQDDVFYSGNVRSWITGKTQVFLPGADNDVFFVFSHILQHYFNRGIGLRQVCDWCRLLWTYRDSLNLRLLESRIRKAGVMTEWKTFATLAVDYLGMPEEAMPFYLPSRRWSYKAKRVLSFIIDTGNFGHNRDLTYYKKYPFIVYKAISLWRHFKDFGRYFTTFPLDSLVAWWNTMSMGIKEVFIREYS